MCSRFILNLSWKNIFRLCLLCICIHQLLNCEVLYIWLLKIVKRSCWYFSDYIDSGIIHFSVNVFYYAFFGYSLFVVIILTMINVSTTYWKTLSLKTTLKNRLQFKNVFWFDLVFSHGRGYSLYLLSKQCSNRKRIYKK